MLDGYFIAVDNLTIEESNRLRRKVETLESKQNEIDLMRHKYDTEMQAMNAKLDKAGLIVDDIKKMLFPNG